MAQLPQSVAPIQISDFGRRNDMPVPSPASSDVQPPPIANAQSSTLGQIGTSSAGLSLFCPKGAPGADVSMLYSPPASNAEASVFCPSSAAGAVDVYSAASSILQASRELLPSTSTHPDQGIVVSSTSTPIHDSQSSSMLTTSKPDKVKEAASALGISHSILKFLYEESAQRTQEAANHDRETVHFRATIERLQQTASWQSAALSERERIIISLHAALQKSEAKAEAEMLQRASLTRQHEEERAKSLDIHKEATAIQRELDVTKEANQQQELALNSLRKQHEDERTESRRAHERDLMTLIAYYEQERRRLTKELEDERAVTTSLSNRIPILQRDLQIAETERASATSNLLQSENDRAAQYQTFSRMQKENADLRARVLSDEEKHAALKDVFREPILDLGAIEESLARIAAEESVQTVEL